MRKKKDNKAPAEEQQVQNQEQERQEPKEILMDLPEVKDIPGQEHVRPPRLREFADITPSSDDEEGKGIPGFDEINMDDQSNVSREEDELLEKSSFSMASEDDQNWEKAKLDNEDEDGEPLNEENEFSGRDLDVPGSEDDDANEEVGEEDEENNSYSLGGDRHD